METNQKLAALQAVVEGMLGSAVDCGTYFKVDSDDIAVLRAAIEDISKTRQEAQQHTTLDGCNLELLKPLKKMVEMHFGAYARDNQPPWVKEARAAIAKAEGRA